MLLAWSHCKVIPTLVSRAFPKLAVDPKVEPATLTTADPRQVVERHMWQRQSESERQRQWHGEKQRQTKVELATLTTADPSQVVETQIWDDQGKRKQDRSGKAKDKRPDRRAWRL